MDELTLEDDNDKLFLPLCEVVRTADVLGSLRGLRLSASLSSTPSLMFPKKTEINLMNQFYQRDDIYQSRDKITTCLQ